MNLNKYSVGIFLVFLQTIFVACVDNKSDLTLSEVDSILNRSITHVKAMSESIIAKEGVLPKSVDENGALVTSTSEWWTSGFYPGTLWYLFEFSKDEELKRIADIYTMRVEDQQFTTDNHDVGFMLYCSFGNGFRLTGNSQYEQIFITGANSLMTRYSPEIKLIKSWDTDRWQFPVIIDNMLNLELLFDVAKRTGDSIMYASAVSHADKTMKHHFRSDYSCWHVVGYDTINGNPYIKQTHQGLNDSSSWARGQAWALYGYTMTYRMTKQKRFLEHALHVANYIVNHPNMPEDKIPMWDFYAPEGSLRDASAAAIIASALIELSAYTEDSKDVFLQFAQEQLKTLSSEQYFAKEGTNANFILKHSVGSFPAKHEVDVPLTYADYYFVEALLRYRDVIKNKR